MITTNNIA